jgi:hypothetical protein
MPCSVVSLPDGTRAIVKMAKRRLPLCRFCRQRPADKLCDFKVPVGDVGHTRTCDTAMCYRCATPVGPDLDYCPNHAAEGAAR